MNAQNLVLLLLFLFALAVGVGEVLESVLGFLVLGRAFTIGADLVAALDEQEVLGVLDRGQAMSN